MKKFISVLLVVLTLVSASPIAEAVCPAIPASIVAEAATIRLSKKSVTLIAGHSTKIKVKGTKKKVKWSSSNKKVATVKNGKITAKKQGKATITAKVGKKKLKCKVTVKPQPPTAKKLSATYYRATNTDALVAIVKNNNKTAVSVTMTVVYFDSKGNMLDKSTDFNYAFEAGRTCILTTPCPKDSNYDPVSYASYKVTYDVREASDTNKKRCGAKYINITSNRADSKILAEVTNVGNKDFSYVHYTTVYYDANNKIIDTRANYSSCKESGKTVYDTIYIPSDTKSEHYELIDYASYKIFVDYAY